MHEREWNRKSGNATRVMFRSEYRITRIPQLVIYRFAFPNSVSSCHLTEPNVRDRWKIFLESRNKISRNKLAQIVLSIRFFFFYHWDHTLIGMRNISFAWKVGFEISRLLIEMRRDIGFSKTISELKLFVKIQLRAETFLLKNSTLSYIIHITISEFL